MVWAEAPLARGVSGKGEPQVLWRFEQQGSAARHTPPLTRRGLLRVLQRRPLSNSLTPPLLQQPVLNIPEHCSLWILVIVVVKGVFINTPVNKFVSDKFTPEATAASPGLWPTDVPYSHGTDSALLPIPMLSAQGSQLLSFEKYSSLSKVGKWMTDQMALHFREKWEESHFFGKWTKFSRVSWASGKFPGKSYLKVPLEIYTWKGHHWIRWPCTFLPVTFMAYVGASVRTRGANLFSPTCRLPEGGRNLLFQVPHCTAIRECTLESERPQLDSGPWHAIWPVPGGRFLNLSNLRVPHLSDGESNIPLYRDVMITKWDNMWKAEHSTSTK